MVRRAYSCESCGDFTYEHNSIKEGSLDWCPVCNSKVQRNLKADTDGLMYEMPAFMEELLRPEWKAKGRRWTQEHKIKGLDH